MEHQDSEGRERLEKALRSPLDAHLRPDRESRLARVARMGADIRVVS